MKIIAILSLFLLSGCEWLMEPAFPQGGVYSGGAKPLYKPTQPSYHTVVIKRSF